jgi:hypothetical protein
MARESKRELLQLRDETFEGGEGDFVCLTCAHSGNWNQPGHGKPTLNGECRAIEIRGVPQTKDVSWCSYCDLWETKKDGAP